MSSGVYNPVSPSREAGWFSLFFALWDLGNRWMQELKRDRRTKLVIGKKAAPKEKAREHQPLAWLVLESWKSWQNRGEEFGGNRWGEESKFQVLLCFLERMPLGSVVFFKETSVNAVFKLCFFFSLIKRNNQSTHIYWVSTMFQVWQTQILPYQAYSLKGETDKHVIRTPEGGDAPFCKTEKSSSSSWDLCPTLRD